ncbi:MAG: methyltransferase domain-containing protein [candidate division NC10 bacterium]|nr:methyltransferase domain-containing protein [candidate division NC10 bacterium]
MSLTETEIKESIIDTYTKVASNGRLVAERFYSPEELQGLPTSAVELALGVGNPARHAALQRGEVVLDLGSGAGIDTLQTARKVGPTGKAIGLDMTPEMIRRARANANAMGMTKVEIIDGPMEAIPLPDASVDVVISNGVINLTMRKSQVFREIHRVLKLGGRFCVADMLVNGELPEDVLNHPTAWTG